MPWRDATHFDGSFDLLDNWLDARLVTVYVGILARWKEVPIDSLHAARRSLRHRRRRLTEPQRPSSSTRTHEFHW